MAWKKPSTEILGRYQELSPKGPGIEGRKMFGFPCLFLNNNMFMGVFESSIFLRLSALDREKFLNLDQAFSFEPMPGRKMKEYVVIPEWLLFSGEVVDWIQRSVSYARSLPPK